eukprot:3650573-Prorocentrum_lima.AAC.1
MRTHRYNVQLLLGDDQQDPDFIDLEEARLLTALKIQYQARGAEFVASLQHVEDPAVLRNLEWEVKKKRANCKVAPKKMKIEDQAQDP